MEVADSSLSQDLTVKANIYSRAGILEYWVLDVSGHELHMHREPTTEGYSVRTIFAAQKTVNLLAFPEVEIAIRDILTA